MLNIRKKISRYMNIVALIITSVLFVLAIILQILNEQGQARANAQDTFARMEKVLASNQQDLENTVESYRKTCLCNAEAIAYIIQYHPEVLDDIDEIKKIAKLLEVDEIHIFDKTGRIFTGTHPEYYDMTFDSGEQIGFFKPLLTDKSLELCQDITPNTAEAKPMQYSALWSENKEFIVQVGMEPVNVTKVTEKNELSYIFSYLQVDPEVSYYAVDIASGEVVGSTVTETVGRPAKEIGLMPETLQKYGESGFHANVNGVDSYCVFSEMGNNLIGRVIANDVFYLRVGPNVIGLIICLGIIAFILVRAVTSYMNTYVIDGIYNINDRLRAISNGDLEERVDVQTSMEFSELSDHINEMVGSLLANTQKISHILNRVKMNIGVYEYHKHSHKVRFTEYIAQLLKMEENELGQYSMDKSSFEKNLENWRADPVSEEEGLFLLNAKEEKYIKIEEISQGNDVYGVIIDMTEEVERRKKLETERDVDLLTGLYNRRGLEHQLEELFKRPEDLGYGALIMVDADGLKEINDNYGHEKGDVYLTQVAETVRRFSEKKGIAARWGGDEFVMFLYMYYSEAELEQTIKYLENIQNSGSVSLGDGIDVQLRFSFGYCLTKDEKDYRGLLQKADERMYLNKRTRKENMKK